MKIIVVVVCLLFSMNLAAQPEKGRSLFFGVNVGTKIANKNYAVRYNGIYSYYGTNETQLEYILNLEQNYNAINGQLGNVGFIVPYDAYSLNTRYTPGLLTGVTMGYQISPTLQVSVDANFNKLKVKDVFTIEVFDGTIQTTERQIRLGEIYAEESRFEGRFNFDHVSEGNKVNFIFGGSGLYSFWRIDEHIAIFGNHIMPIYSKFSNVPPSDINVERGGGWGFGLNLGIEYRVNDKIMSQIMYQPYQAFMNYGIPINKRILLQHDITVRFLWK